MRREEGYAAVWGTLLVAFLVLVVGGITDVYLAYHYRVWAYEVAGEAARRAVIEGMVWPPPSSFYMTGEMPLDPGKARTIAQAFVRNAMAERGITTYTVEVRVLPAGGEAPDFPPVPQAVQDGEHLVLSGPGVGVYVEFPVPTTWLGVVARNTFTVHAFAAAQMDPVWGP